MNLKPSAAATRSLLEIAFWAIPVGLFLAIYIGYFNAPASVIAPHVFIVASIFFGGVGLRMLWASTRNNHKLGTYIPTIIALAPWLLVAGWYAAALIGLTSWGRVTTWPIFRTYASQAPLLLETLGYPGWILFIVPVVIIALVIAVAKTRLFRPDWVTHIYALAPRKQALALASLLSALPLLLFSMIHFTEPLHAMEPIEMSLYPRLFEVQESMAYSVSPQINAEEALERNNYKIPERSKKEKRNIVLIVGDALRADHMGVYGYSRNTTPYISSLYSSGKVTLFPNAYSTCAESMCGYKSLASSRPVHQLPTKPFILHEVLKRAGYKTHLILSGDHTSFYGLREMYGNVDSYFDGKDQPIRWGNADETFLRYINDDNLVIDQLDKFPEDRNSDPIFLQIVLMSSHGLGTRHPENNVFKPYFNYYAWFGKKIPNVTPEQRQETINFYDNGTFQFDKYVNKILNILKSKKVLDNALVIITGDHGEMLDELSLYSHGVGVREPVLHVPLLIARFGYTKPEFPKHDIASLIDVAPTILNEIDLPVPSTWKGTSLQQQDASRDIYFQQKHEAGLYTKNDRGEILKYWRDFKNSEDHTYNISKDPKESIDITASMSRQFLATQRAKVAHGALQVGETNNISIAFPLINPNAEMHNNPMQSTHRSK